MGKNNVLEEFKTLRPKCGFCSSEVKGLPAMTSGGITLYCCENCGSVLGITEKK